ncbi:MAG: PKD domain-containing protein [Bacteroidota bacterium]|nr:PKD domain-containing protein [Bacteroidota bacterium]
MKKQFLLLIILLVAWIALLLSCKKELSCENCNTSNNKPPVANAGSDQIIVLPKDSVMLDGSASSDPDGKIVSFKWSKISGPALALLLTPDSVRTMVESLAMGVYQFRLTVTDNGGLTAADTVQVIVNNPSINRPPVAIAGGDRNITLPVDSTPVDGTNSFDPDNDIVSYLWTKIAGPAAYRINYPRSVNPIISGLVQGVYQIELKVTDPGGLFSKDTMQITVNAPVTTTCDNSNRPLINAQLIPVGTLSQARQLMAVATAGNKILFAGGADGSSVGHSSRVDIYDLTTQTWSAAELCAGRNAIAAVAAGNKIFFGGGETGDGTWPVDSVDIYDVSTNTWKVTHLSTAGHGIAAAYVGDKVFFAGGNEGFSGSWSRGSLVDIYNLTTNTWSTTTLSGIRRSGHSAVTVNNKVYFSGGETWPGALVPGTWYASNTIDIYDNATNSWSTSTMMEGKLQHAGIAVGDKIYWAGGTTGYYNASLHESCLVEIRDVNTGSSLAQYLSSPGSRIAAVKDNKIVFIRVHGNDTNKFYIYDIATNTWSIGILPVNIDGASIISVNNIIYLAGGSVNGILSDKVWKLEF